MPVVYSAREAFHMMGREPAPLMVEMVCVSWVDASLILMPKRLNNVCLCVSVDFPWLRWLSAVTAERAMSVASAKIRSSSALN